MSTENEFASNSTSPEIVAQEVRDKLADRGLPPSFAKLYSQHTRLGTNQPSLRNWREDEVWERLHDAMRLTACGLLERDAEVEGWQNSLRRAGELLEWLSHSELNPHDLPLLLISSAAYQLAGYPARSTGLLNQHSLDDEHSRILYYFLKADFRSLFEEISRFWAESDSPITPTDLPWEDGEALSNAMHGWITTETVSALGVLCSYMRWGDEDRIRIAINKLSAIADMFLHGRDPYSWLLAKLCSEVASIYISTSLRNNLFDLVSTVSIQGQSAFESYMRQSYLLSRGLAWPSQSSGINRLQEQDSFVLCTPTGSGKTTVAEIAILQSLFAPEELDESDPLAWLDYLDSAKPLALYLVPSRALATEVEAKLSKVVDNVSNERILVTGLYGGNDWGPTDAWITANDRAILICTYEKGEALIRFLGTVFLNRVALVVIDEAHNILFDGNHNNLSSGESRALRLESLSARLLAFLEDHDSRIIALSAVAAGMEELLANWITASDSSTPISKPYRSTRQLIGCLECSMSGRTDIRYDLLDNAGLTFDNRRGAEDRPYIPNPFPNCPIPVKWHKEGAEKRIRPLLFWAATHLTQTEDSNRLRSVLISASQHIGGYAESFLELLGKAWANVDLPTFFHPPTEYRKAELWQQSLAACEDYFTKRSREYQLLEKGIVVHHGKMPGLLARLLIQLIDKRIVNIVLATSTLSEGVNLPFETVLIPSLQRWEQGTGQRSLTAQEFANLVGRAGRPGFGTEGRSLVVLPSRERGDSRKELRQVSGSRERYTSILRKMQHIHENLNQQGNSLRTSPLAELLRHLVVQWRKLSQSDSSQDFFNWLEKISPIEEQSKSQVGDEPDYAIQTLDSLDAVLIAAVVELEQLRQEELTPDELENRLQKIWHRSYAYYATAQESTLQNIFVRRGIALQQTVYHNKSYRRRLYRTGLPPVSGNKLLSTYSELITHLQTGIDYAEWSELERIKFIESAISSLSNVQQFSIGQPSKNVSWQDVLSWWLAPQKAKPKPTKTQVSSWHGFVSKNFQYRFNWGLGSVVALATDEVNSDRLSSPSLEDWPKTQLPWIVFWMKELIVWGTLDPVVAYLLAHKFEVTRPMAEQVAEGYYNTYADTEPTELHNASTIRKWAESLRQNELRQQTDRFQIQKKVELLRDFTGHKNQWRVIPVIRNSQIEWLDPAGYSLAKSSLDPDWDAQNLHLFDFWLDSDRKIIISNSYM